MKRRSRKTHAPGAPRRSSLWLAVVLVAAHGLTRAESALGATDLRLAPGLSFTDDSSDDFPVRGEDMEDAESRPGRATVMFFGASHCWNTNREAERLVALYPKFRDRVHFIIVDVNRPSTTQRPLMKSYYRGSIPTLVVLAPDGEPVYARAGETARTRGDTRGLDALITRALGE